MLTGLPTPPPGRSAASTSAETGQAERTGPSVSIVVSAYMEQASIEACVRSLLASDSPLYMTEGPVDDQALS
ncbi:MAG: hypothetical protein DLM58_23500 [Pseudonocardiales bacterium]|nr:MAG: hypothetical protein DLM58_23500 [Pseudonocardiales bacterium]